MPLYSDCNILPQCHCGQQQRCPVRQLIIHIMSFGKKFYHFYFILYFNFSLFVCIRPLNFIYVVIITGAVTLSAQRELCWFSFCCFDTCKSFQCCNLGVSSVVRRQPSATAAFMLICWSWYIFKKKNCSVFFRFRKLNPADYVWIIYGFSFEMSRVLKCGWRGSVFKVDHMCM